MPKIFYLSRLVPVLSINLGPYALYLNFDLYYKKEKKRRDLCQLLISGRLASPETSRSLLGPYRMYASGNPAWMRYLFSG
ncbi:hypothetical protein GYMLUDRAFT_46393 [Collybiopsis luxurians FD-317 M1]|uniref:Uncharacterized protein n=1 Tax=Collybiopsis luxurians FD-317 M1 TaxID=944289 RepID=A0A0D0C3Z4_9AGAR|nr:hypothetical protein GYMLUDRAFT_46393 [Collybiopsis luxurians FD-317 M1]